jgi:hypothetical protein
MEVFDVLSDLKDKVQVDARQRKFVWPDGKRLTLQESIERARKRYPDISSKQIEEHLGAEGPMLFSAMDSDS